MQLILTRKPTKKTRAPRTESDQRGIKVWDVPTRLFHWSMVALVIVSWFTADQGFMQTHLISGLALLGLLVFRMVWGVIGSTTARFGNFLYAPTKVASYFKLLIKGETPIYVGHNPAGGLMVFALITVLTVQVTTGLFANDGVKFHGPLALQISSDMSDYVTKLHMWLFNGILLLVWTHLVAIFFYYFVKNENLIGPMVSGYKSNKDVPRDLQLKFTDPKIAIAVFCVIAGAIAITLL